MSQSVRLMQNQGATTVTPSDANLLGNTTTGIFVGGAGNLSVVMSDNTTVTLTGVTAGTFLPISVQQIKATGTTATNIVAFYAP